MSVLPMLISIESFKSRTNTQDTIPTISTAKLQRPSSSLCFPPHETDYQHPKTNEEFLKKAVDSTKTLITPYEIQALHTDVTPLFSSVISGIVAEVARYGAPQGTNGQSVSRDV